MNLSKEAAARRSAEAKHSTVSACVKASGASDAIIVALASQEDCELSVLLIQCALPDLKLKTWRIGTV